ncbi:glycoside hydrolase family 10 protein [Lihuaxuella thermophila]|uniref:glycoside hydrolase family 10 protein n=1 Tax=Lihuaxuella thermophila TaxID=1173111 RepID=UPI003CC7A3AD
MCVSLLALVCSLVLVLPGILHAEDGAAKEMETYVSPKRQLRAVWIATVVNIDWPSRTGLPKEQQQQEFIRILDESKAMGMNAVVVQVRPTADAFYPSRINPWSKYLTGVQGQDPGYDPLAFMIREAHKRNLEFHAWFNPYRVSMDTKIENLVPNHPARLHPDWVISYGGRLYYNPGIPEAKDHIIESIMEAVKNYDIDAVHFDDYFYPYPVSGQDFPDEAAYQKYGAAQFPQKADWRRHNVNTLIRELSEAIKQEKPYVKFGISPFGIWRNKSTDPTGSDTAGLQSYDAVYADTRTWIRQGWIDYVTPQIYWNFGYPPAAYEKLTDWWSREVRGRNTHLYIGQAAYKVGISNPPAWQNPEELPNQLKHNLLFAEIKGSIFFSFKDLRRNPLGIKDRLTQEIYKVPALVPAMPWLDDEPPKKPKLKAADWTSEGVEVIWRDHPLNDSAYFVVYRFDGHQVQNIEDATHMLATVRKTGLRQSFLDQTARPGQEYTYVVTAVDRLHNESAVSNSITLKSK